MDSSGISFLHFAFLQIIPNALYGMNFLGTLYEAMIDASRYGNAVIKTLADRVSIVPLEYWFPVVDRYDKKKIVYQVIAFIADNTIYVEIHEQGRVFSTSGTNPNYPYLYSTPFSSTYQNFHPRCRHIITQYIESLHTPEENERMREFSNRSYEIGGDGWTRTQTKAAENSLQNYREGQDRKRRIYNDRKQYERYKMVLGEDAPKTFSGFRKMKTANGERWKFTQLDYRRRNKLIDNPELALPNAAKATAADAKFTKYLFNKNNADGWAKGRAFESRLGYNIDNWKELQKDIVKRAQIYPATAGETDQYGIRYTQHIVLYGNNGKPANVRVGWKVSEDKTWLTTALIKEMD